MTDTRKPTKQQDERQGVLSGKEEFSGKADEKLRHMGEKTPQAEHDSPAKPDQTPQKP